MMRPNPNAAAYGAEGNILLRLSKFTTATKKGERWEIWKRLGHVKTTTRLIEVIPIERTVLVDGSMDIDEYCRHSQGRGEQPYESNCGAIWNRKKRYIIFPLIKGLIVISCHTDGWTTANSTIWCAGQEDDSVAIQVRQSCINGVLCNQPWRNGTPIKIVKPRWNLWSHFSS